MSHVIIDKMQGYLANNEASAHADTANVSAVLNILKNDISQYDKPPPPRPSPKIGLAVDNTKGDHA